MAENQELAAPACDQSVVIAWVRQYVDACRNGGGGGDAAPLPTGANRLPTLLEKVKYDIERAWRCNAKSPIPTELSGDRRCVEHHLDQYPELKSQPAKIVELIRAEITARPNSEQELPHYLHRFPYLEGEIRTLFVPQKEDERLPVIPGYVVEHKAGAGGMGIVYKGFHIALQRDVAIKVIRSAENASKEDRRRFLIEAKSIAQVKHPNIVEIFDIGERENANGEKLPYFSMTWIPGRTYARYLQEEKQRDLRREVTMLSKVAKAVDAAHRSRSGNRTYGIIHRDLKPSNIFLATDRDSKGDFVPYVLDFGLAKRIESTDAGADDTKDGTVFGTPHYMAMEQARGEQCTPSVDIHALGAILYETVSGRPPYQANGWHQTLLQALDPEHTPPPLNVKSGIDPDLATISQKCLAKWPADRWYKSADEFAEDLDLWLDGRPIKARPLGWVEWSTKFVRRNWEAVAVLAILLILVAGIITQAIVQSHLSNENRKAGIADQVAAVLPNGPPETYLDQLKDLETYGKAKSLPILHQRHRVAVQEIVDVILKGTNWRETPGGRLRDLLRQWEENRSIKLSRLVGKDPSGVFDELQELAEISKELSKVRDIQRLHKAVWRYRLALFVCSEGADRSGQIEILQGMIGDAEPEDLVASLPLIKKGIDDIYQKPEDRSQLEIQIGNGIMSKTPGRVLLNHAAVLAALTKDTTAWQAYTDRVAADLATQEKPYFDTYVRALREVGHLLRRPLATIAISAGRKEERRFATLALIQFCTAQSETKHLTTAVLDNSDPEVFELLRSEFRNFDDAARSILSNNLQPVGTPDPEPIEFRRFELAKRRVNAGLALALGEKATYDFVDLLKHAEDPTTRCLLIERLAGLNLDVASPLYLKLLGLKAEPRADDREALVPVDHTSIPPDAIRAAGVMVIGSLPPGRASSGDQRRLQPFLREWYWTTGDPELHAACSWLLRKWKLGLGNDGLRLRQSAVHPYQFDDRLAKALPGERRWYLASGDPDAMLLAVFGAVGMPISPLEQGSRLAVSLDGHTRNSPGMEMVLFKGPIVAELGTLSPAVEPELLEDASTRSREPVRWRRIERSFAIGAFEVTVEDYLRFVNSKDYELLAEKNPSVFPPRAQFTYRKLHSPTSDSPINGVTWFQAVAFANWLSIQHGIKDEELCIPRADWSKIGPGMKMPLGYLRKTGYRLPTEAEWEYACRGGTRTPSPCGSKMLLKNYACYANEDMLTADIARMIPVGSFKPNPYGLFDMLGNATEWIMEPVVPALPCDRDHALPDAEWIGDIKDLPTIIHRHVMRGGSFYQLGSRVRSAYRFYYQPSIPIENGGFRIARTLPSK